MSTFGSSKKKLLAGQEGNPCEIPDPPHIDPFKIPSFNEGREGGPQAQGGKRLAAELDAPPPGWGGGWVALRKSHGQDRALFAAGSPAEWKGPRSRNEPLLTISPLV